MVNASADLLKDWQVTCTSTRIINGELELRLQVFPSSFTVLVLLLIVFVVRLQPTTAQLSSEKAEALKVFFQNLQESKLGEHQFCSNDMFKCSLFR